MACTMNIQSWTGPFAAVLLPAGAVAKVPGICGPGLAPLTPRG